MKTKQASARADHSEPGSVRHHKVNESAKPKEAPAPAPKQAPPPEPPKPGARSKDLEQYRMGLEAQHTLLDSFPEARRRKVMEGANEIRGTVRRLGEPCGSDAFALVASEMAMELASRL